MHHPFESPQPDLSGSPYNVTGSFTCPLANDTCAWKTCPNDCSLSGVRAGPFLGALLFCACVFFAGNQMKPGPHVALLRRWLAIVKLSFLYGTGVSSYAGAADVDDLLA